MISIEHSEYLLFLANYFKVDPQTILEKSIVNNIISASDSSEVISSTLQSLIGYQRRLLEPLSVAFTKNSAFDTIVFIHKIISFDKHYSLLIDDDNNIFKLLYFKKDPAETLPLHEHTIVKIDSCFVKDTSLATNQIPKLIWFYEFPAIFSIREYHIDNLPDCIYDESYTKITNLVTIIGYFLITHQLDKIFCFIHSKELQIRVIPYKLESLPQDLSTKLVKITYCELEYGPDAFQLKLTEFSDFSSLSPISLSLSLKQFSSLLRFEYPSTRMSLIELTDKAVACTKVRILQTDYSDSTWKFYGYDSSQAVCLTVFDTEFGDHIANSLSDDSFFLIDGIYRRGTKFYLRERLENISIISLEEEDDITIPVSRPDQI